MRFFRGTFCRCGKKNLPTWSLQVFLIFKHAKFSLFLEQFKNS